MLQALLFDCDGVLVDTERDGHRVAFNEAFARKGLATTWDVPLYGELLTIAGGKERMIHHFDRAGWPTAATDRQSFIQELHLLKTDLFMAVIAEGRLPLRPGVARLVDEAIAAGIPLAVCSTSNERAVTLVVERMLGKTRAPHFRIFAGDIVKKKKPDPAIYLLASREMGIPSAGCMVVEDSANGLAAAKAAGMRCLVTTSSYTLDEDFSSADRIVPELGDDPVRVQLADCQRLLG